MAMDVEQLVTELIDCAREVRRHLKQGFEERVYKNAMFIELVQRGINVRTEAAYDVRYKGELVGHYRADMVAENAVVLELKAIRELSIANEVQLVNYLNASGIDHGLLINFGGDLLVVKRKYRVYRPSHFVDDIVQE